jgi:hypothetical protein
MFLPPPCFAISKYPPMGRSAICHRYSNAPDSPFEKSPVLTVKRTGILPPGGGRMLGLEDWMDIRSLHQQGLSVSEIARREGIERKTVRKYLCEAPRG